MSNKKKMEVLYFVEQYIKRYGYPPTVRDIGKGLGYRSPSTVHGYLRQLKEEHLIESDGSKPRTPHIDKIVRLKSDKSPTESPTSLML